MCFALVHKLLHHLYLFCAAKYEQIEARIKFAQEKHLLLNIFQLLAKSLKIDSLPPLGILQQTFFVSISQKLDQGKFSYKTSQAFGVDYVRSRGVRQLLHYWYHFMKEPKITQYVCYGRSCLKSKN